MQCGGNIKIERKDLHTQTIIKYYFVRRKRKNINRVLILINELCESAGNDKIHKSINNTRIHPPAERINNRERLNTKIVHIYTYILYLEQ